MNASNASGRRPRLATVWLGGCAGCHMSVLDIDERLLALAARADIVYSPIIDVKEFPEDVDVTLVEGAIANEDHLEMIRRVRERTGILIALGDCAVTGNVTALRNVIPLQEVLGRAGYPVLAEPVPRLLPLVQPIHKVVRVDAYLPGCPPSADLIWQSILDLLDGKSDDKSKTVPRFG